MKIRKSKKMGMSTVSKVYYLAGPMSGLPQFNYPLFYSAAEKLRANGYDVKSPAEMDTPAMQAAAMASPDGNLASLEKTTGETWGDVLAKDVKLISDHITGGIIVLPNWFKSRGARLEVMVAKLKQLPVYEYNPDLPSIITTLNSYYVSAGILGHEFLEDVPEVAYTING